MSLRNYDPEKVVVSFRGIIIRGFASDTFVSAERTEDTFSMDVGSKGDVTRVRSRNKTGSVTLTLQAASPTNDLLSNVAFEDEVSGTGIGPLMIKDLNGTTLVNAANAWIRKLPVMERSSGASNVEWTIDVERMDKHIGGFVV